MCSVILCNKRNMYVCMRHWGYCELNSADTLVTSLSCPASPPTSVTSVYRTMQYLYLYSTTVLQIQRRRVFIIIILYIWIIWLFIFHARQFSSSLQYSIIRYWTLVMHHSTDSVNKSIIQWLINPQLQSKSIL